MGKALKVSRGGGVTLTKWAKYTVKTVSTTGYVAQSSSGQKSLNSMAMFPASYSLNGTYTNTETANITAGMYFKLTSGTTDTVYLVSQATVSDGYGYLSYNTIYVWQTGSYETYDQFVKYVYCSEIDEYPTNGKQNGYWYIKQ